MSPANARRPPVFVQQLHRAVAQRGRLDPVYQDLSDHWTAILQHLYPFGYEALVLPGVKIGHGAVVAAASVVASDVPPYAVVAGNPARIIRRRFDEGDVERLLHAAWWDWPPARITAHARAIMSGTPAELERIAHEMSRPAG